MPVCVGNCHQMQESSFKLSSIRFEPSTIGATVSKQPDKHDASYRLHLFPGMQLDRVLRTIFIPVSVALGRADDTTRLAFWAKEWLAAMRQNRITYLLTEFLNIRTQVILLSKFTYVI